VAEYVPGAGEKLAEEQQEQTQRPRRYRVVMLNDDYTTMEFVVQVLRGVFRKSAAEAVQIMLRIHHEGAGVCGVYPAAIAETKVATVHDKARDAGYPLRCAMEPE
jgi:ATP-dependent Clp protease adaptor protein ClpS